MRHKTRLVMFQTFFYVNIDEYIMPYDDAAIISLR